jgi:choline dehydrogenase
MSDGNFDYVIVGAGPAGCVLANRLTADSGKRVALIEAGGPDKAREIHIPAAFTKLFQTAYDWNYHTVKQPQAGGRELYWPRGRTLGGSTSINAMMWLWGHRADYDDWPWSYEDVVPYYRRIGVEVSALRDPNPATKAFLAACAEAGLPLTPDVNGGDNSGFAQTPVTQHRGRRVSAADAYLVPAAGRPNLTLITNALVERIVLDGDRATGVHYRDSRGNTRSLTVQREVLVAAGAVNSPQLLMLSGIGDPDHLRSVGVEVRHDLPAVGTNLQDHLASAVMVTSRQPVTMFKAETFGQIVRYLTTRRGMLTSNVAEACGFLRSDPALAAPDLELIFAPSPFNNHGLDPLPGHGLTIGVILLRPESTGRITLASANPTEHPLIDPGYLTDARDVDRLAFGMRVAERIAATEALKPFVGDPMVPYPGVVDDDTLRESIRANAETLYHPVGTCAMGSVVDSDLRVKGIRGLRVVDASVFPRITRGHTMAPVYMVAERAADLIKAS